MQLKKLWCPFLIAFFANGRPGELSMSDIETKAQEFMKEGKIPGMSLVIVRGNKQYLRSFGYADSEKKIPVTTKTLFELGSCSKAFTALAILKLEIEGRLNLDDYVSDYLPWFRVTYKNVPQKITLQQLMHHTSGIPWQTISKIPQSDGESALTQTIRAIVGTELNHPPGKEFEYATVNYDILGAIIEKVSGLSFERYTQANILGPLNMYNTRIGRNADQSNLATGYKIGFFAPRAYDAPVYRGNNPSAYVISDAEDMLIWLKLQMGIIKSDLGNLVRKAQMRDTTVGPRRYDLSSYAMGWNVSLRGDGEIYHAGLNPNFSAFVAFRPEQKLGVVVLANSNSSALLRIGEYVLTGETLDFGPDHSLDKAFSVLSFIFAAYLFSVVVYFISIVVEILRRRRRLEPLSGDKVGKLLLPALIMAPFFYGIFLLPKAMAGFSWEAAIVWTPISFTVLMILVLTSVILSYFTYLFSLFFPQSDKYKKSAPLLIVLSLLSGISNMILILIITSSINRSGDLKYVLYYFGLTFLVYILGRQFVQTKLIHITTDIIYDLRINLIEKILSTSYDKFEKINRGRVYATLNDDTGTIGNAAGVIVSLITSVITVVVAFLYLATIAFWATILTIFMILTITTIYYLVDRRVKVLFEEARDTRNVYMDQINSLINGFKELSIHYNKKIEYKKDLEETSATFRQKSNAARIRLVNAFLVGESLLIIVLALVAFAIPNMFPELPSYTLWSFVIVLLYLIGPINAILGSAPAFMQLRIAWTRIQQFLREIPANLDLQHMAHLPLPTNRLVHSLEVRDLFFHYKNDHNGNGNFSVGPVDFEVHQGEILFIVGGNGSGKTTLAKIITGLYPPDGGSIKINGKSVSMPLLGEYFTTVYNPYHLFSKLYEIDVTKNEQAIADLLRLLDLTDKVTMQGKSYSTIDLSGGQRKRLALLQCYLEDRPIFLFDELAADQDPQFRRFFYRDLLMTMKQMGKIVIAITHDDHYFDVSDKIIKMDLGKIDVIEDRFAITAERETSLVEEE